MASVALFVSMVGGCSNKIQEKPASEPKATSKQMTTHKAEETPAVRHEKCQYHNYPIAPGESVSVTFERLIDADMVKIISEEEPTVQKEALEDLGYSVSYSSRSVDSFTQDLPVWAVSEPDFAVKDNERVIYYPAPGGQSIDWNRTGEGVITFVSNTSGKFKVGKLPLDRVVGKSGTIEIKGPNKRVYSLTPFQKNITQEFHILSVTLGITAPSQYSQRMPTTSGNVVWKGRNIIEFTISHALWDTKANKVMITGPETSRDCL